MMDDFTENFDRIQIFLQRNSNGIKISRFEALLLQMGATDHNLTTGQVAAQLVLMWSVALPLLSPPLPDMCGRGMDLRSIRRPGGGDGGHRGAVGD
jgi:hypothetical protein